MTCPECNSDNVRKENDRPYNEAYRKVNIICDECGHIEVMKYHSGERIQKDQAEILVKAKETINGEYDKVVLSGLAICEHCGIGYSPEDYAEHFALCSNLDSLIKQKVNLEIEIGKLKEKIKAHNESIKDKYTATTDTSIDYTNPDNVEFFKDFKGDIV